MNVDAERLEDEDSLTSEAVAWFLRVARADAPLEVLSAWQQWLERSEANRAAYESIQRTWGALDDVSPLPWPTDAEVERDRYAGETAVHRLGEARPSAFRWPVAASVGCCRRTHRSVDLACHLGDARNLPADVSTGTAEHRETRLPDGSRVEVGARSSVKIDFAQHHRQIHLISGEAFFSVAKDANRPFVVDAGLGRVTAVGTAFNVRRYGTSLAVEVAEGQVRLESTKKRQVRQRRRQARCAKDRRRCWTQAAP